MPSIYIKIVLLFAIIGILVGFQKEILKQAWEHIMCFCARLAAKIYQRLQVENEHLITTNIITECLPIKLQNVFQTWEGCGLFFFFVSPLVTIKILKSFVYKKPHKKKLRRPPQAKLNRKKAKHFFEPYFKEHCQQTKKWLWKQLANGWTNLSSSFGQVEVWPVVENLTSDMRSFQQRLSSLRPLAGMNRSISLPQLAQQGIYFEGRNNRLTCFCCRASTPKDQFSEGIVPTHNQGCTAAAGMEHENYSDTFRAGSENPGTNPTPSEASAAPQQELRIKLKSRYASVLERRNSFNDVTWAQGRHSAMNLAEAGLYYSDVGDKVVCWSCGFTLIKWTGQKNFPLKEKHKEYCETCRFADYHPQ